MDNITKKEVKDILLKIYNESPSLQKCRFKGEHEANSDLLSYIPKDKVEIFTKAEMIKSLVDYIMNEKPTIETFERGNGNKVYRKDLMIFEPSEFVDLVIEVIRVSPKRLIDNITY